MKIQIDTDKTNEWVKKHSQLCLVAGLGFLSWFAAERATVLSQGISVWWCFVSILSGCFSGSVAWKWLYD